MLDRYRAILAYPGARAFTFAGLLSRLPISMFNISLILMVQIQYDSYAMAGRVAAIGTLIWAAQTLPTARIVDRVGQRRAMWPMIGLHLVGVAMAVTTAMVRGPEVWLWTAAVFASLSGPLGSLTRARWSHILRSDDDVHTAFSLEGSLDELLFIGGPTLSAILCVGVHPAAGLLVSSAALLGGAVVLLSQSSTEPPPRSAEDGAPLGLRVPRAVIAVTLIATALGMMFGAIDISTVAFADAEGHKAWAGPALAVLSLGSFIGGLANGAVRWTVDLWVRVVGASVLVALGFTVMALQPTLVLFAIVGFFAGAVIAPLLAGTDTTIQRAVRGDQLTEGLAWLRIGIGIGVAAGAWAAGVLIETQSARAALALAAVAAALVAVAALSTIPWLRAVRGGSDALAVSGADPALPR